MNGQRVGGATVVTLSESNLRALLAKVQNPESGATLTRYIAALGLLVVGAEADAVHYHSEDREPVARGARGATAEDGHAGTVKVEAPR